MNFTTVVALLILSLPCLAGNSVDLAQDIESQWAKIYYTLPKNQQSSAFNDLLEKTTNAIKSNPNDSEMLFWQAVIMATNAELQDGLSALNSIKAAHELLNKAISINPKTANGSAYVTLGTLYYLSPNWPIAYGDDEKAEQMFLNALKINPNSIDANYFYGDFLLESNRRAEAIKFFEKALSSPSRKEQQFADDKLKIEVKLALSNAKERKVSGVKNLFSSLFTAAN